MPDSCKCISFCNFKYQVKCQVLGISLNFEFNIIAIKKYLPVDKRLSKPRELRLHQNVFDSRFSPSRYFLTVCKTRHLIYQLIKNVSTDVRLHKCLQAGQKKDLELCMCKSSGKRIKFFLLFCKKTKNCKICIPPPVQIA